MRTPLQALEEYDVWRSADRQAMSTGFAGLDDLTGGFRRGQVWLVVGEPGHGRTVLAEQWALLLARDHRLTVDLLSVRDSTLDVVTRMLARLGRIALHRLRERPPAAVRAPDLEAARREFTALPIRLGAVAEAAELLDRGTAAEVVVVDDLDGFADHGHAGLSALAAERDVLVIATMPWDSFVVAGRPDPRWWQLADVVVQVHRTQGETPQATLRVVRSQVGFGGVVTAGFEGHYARWVDERPSLVPVAADGTA